MAREEAEGAMQKEEVKSRGCTSIISKDKASKSKAEQVTTLRGMRSKANKRPWCDCITRDNVSGTWMFATIMEKLNTIRGNVQGSVKEVGGGLELK